MTVIATLAGPRGGRPASPVWRELDLVLDGLPDRRDRNRGTLDPSQPLMLGRSEPHLPGRLAVSRIAFAALAEIRRVLIADGRLFVSCWAALTDSPGYHPCYRCGRLGHHLIRSNSTRGATVNDVPTSAPGGRSPVFGVVDGKPLPVLRLRQVRAIPVSGIAAAPVSSSPPGVRGFPAQGLARQDSLPQFESGRPVVGCPSVRTPSSTTTSPASPVILIGELLCTVTRTVGG